MNVEVGSRAAEEVVDGSCVREGTCRTIDVGSNQTAYQEINIQTRAFHKRSDRQQNDHKLEPRDRAVWSCYTDALCRLPDPLTESVPPTRRRLRMCGSHSAGHYLPAHRLYCRPLFEDTPNICPVKSSRHGDVCLRPFSRLYLGAILTTPPNCPEVGRGRIPLASVPRYGGGVARSCRSQQPTAIAEHR